MHGVVSCMQSINNQSALSFLPLGQSESRIAGVWTTYGASRAVEAGSETRGALQGSERETSIEVVAKSYRDSLVRRTKELSLWWKPLRSSSPSPMKSSEARRRKKQAEANTTTTTGVGRGAAKCTVVENKEKKQEESSLLRQPDYSWFQP